MICEKCGHEVNSNALVCGYCGHSLQKSQLSPEKQRELENNARSDESLKPNHHARIRGFGIALMIISGIIDIISIAMIGSSSVEGFSTILIISSVAFGLGLLLTFAFR